MPGLTVEMVVLGTDFLVNGYVVGCAETRKGVVVDPGFEAEKILKAVAKAGGVAEKELLSRRRDSTLRAVASRMLCRHGGLTQREAARALGLKTGGAISCQLRNLDEMIRSDRRLLKLVEQLDRNLAGKKR